MVHRIGLFLRRYDKNTIRGVGLLACWFAGSSLGLCAACVCGDAYASFLQPLTGCLPEFGGVFASAVFPLLLSACAVFFFRSAGCYGMCLLRSLTQGFLLGLVGGLYGSAAPLMAFLLLFSGLCVNPVLLFFWLRRLAFGTQGLRNDTIVCLGLCTMIGAMDYLVIAPFLVDVINL